MTTRNSFRASAAAWSLYELNELQFRLLHAMDIY